MPEMSMEETVTINLEVNMTQFEDNIRRVETLLFRALGLAHRMGLDEDIEKQIIQLQRLVMVIRLAHSAWIAFEAATGPPGWALAIISGLTASALASDFVLSAGG